MRVVTAVCVIASLLSTSAFAAETVNYSYDALGRLKSSASTGSVNNGVTATGTYDPAGNRSNYTVAGASSSSPAFQVVVLPISGFTIIPINPVN